MSPSALRRVGPAASVALLSAFGVLLGAATPAAAHSVEGGELPAPSWLLGYGMAFAVLITAVALRSAWPRARRVLSSEIAVTEARGPAIARPTGAEPAAGPTPIDVHVGHVLGSLLLAAVLVAALAGPEERAFNVAPRAVLIGWWVVLPVVVLLVGDLAARINPFVLPVALVERIRGGRPATGTGAPEWTSAAFLGGFSWYFLAFHDAGSPRALAAMLGAYSAAAIAGGAWWGRGWLRTGEGFAGLSAAVARLSWRTWDRRPVAGLPALMVVWVGGVLFDAVSSTSWWADVVGNSRGWGATSLGTVGLGWAIAVAGGAYLATVAAAERVGSGAHEAASGRSTAAEAGLRRGLGLALVPLAVGWFLAHDLTLLLVEGQNLLVALSDPLGRGWDLIGTSDLALDFTIVEQPWVRWVQVALLTAGHLASVVLAHDVALQLLQRAAAMRVTWAVAVLGAASSVTAVLLVLG